MSYLDLLETSWKKDNHVFGASSRLQFLSEAIFNFTTYDKEQAEILATKALKVCAALQNQTTQQLISDPTEYTWYLAMLNMPFFIDKISWGTSIRRPWWDWHGTLYSDSLYNGTKQLLSLEFTRSTWPTFIDALLTFSEVKL